MSPTQLLGIVLIAPFVAGFIMSLTEVYPPGGRYSLWASLALFIIGLALLIGGKYYE